MPTNQAAGTKEKGKKEKEVGRIRHVVPPSDGFKPHFDKMINR